MTKTQSILDRDGQIILSELGVKEMPEKDSAEVVQALMDHFTKVIIETVVLNLDDKQIAEFKAAIADPKNLEERITILTARVPGLAEKIEEAVSNEFAVLKAARERINK